MKKWFLMSMILILITGIIGCSKGEKDGKVTLNALFMKQAGYSEEDVNNITKEFEKNNPNIKIKATFAPYEALEQKIQTSAKSGGYDVVVIDAPWTAKFAKAGFVKDVTDKLKSDDKSDIFTGAIDSVSYDGKVYGMPWLNDTKFLFYNKEILEKAGIQNPPTNFDELNEQAKVIQEKKLVPYPIVWSWSQAEALVCDFTAITSSFGGKMTDESGKPTLNDPKNVAALKYMTETLNEKLTDPKSTEYLEEDVRGVFSSGKAAFALNWTYMYNMANDEKESSVAGKVGIAPIPMSVNGGMGLSVTSGSKHVDEAWKYIQYLSSKDVQKNYAKNALPIWKSLYEEQKVIDTNPEVVAASKTQYAQLENRPRVPWYGALSTEIQVEVQKSLLGKQTPEETMDILQKKAEEISSK
ncbi:ABC transporter substrate-binding protein [Bacillus sp. 1P10SD]|uniref:ABC transporter substrate-binding protein n=1 Tax=Bacillus sp. 1P10SD TaxID=3132265 RepID=UPI0039A5611B